MNNEKWAKLFYAIGKEWNGNYYYDEYHELAVMLENGRKGYVSTELVEELSEARIMFQQENWNALEQIRFLSALYEKLTHSNMNFYLKVTGLKEDEATEEEWDVLSNLTDYDYQSHYRGIAFGEKALEALSLLKKLDCNYLYQNGEIQLEEKLFGRGILLHPDAEKGSVRLYFQNNSGWYPEKGAFVFDIRSKEELDGRIAEIEHEIKEIEKECRKYNFHYKNCIYDGFPLFEILTESGKTTIMSSSEIAGEYQKEQHFLHEVNEMKEYMKSVVQKEYPAFDWNKETVMFGFKYALSVEGEYGEGISAKLFSYEHLYDSVSHLKETFDKEWAAQMELNKELEALTSKEYASWDSETRTIAYPNKREEWRCSLFENHRKEKYWELSLNGKQGRRVNNIEEIREQIQSRIDFAESFYNQMIEIRNWFYENVDYGYAHFSGEHLAFGLFGEEKRQAFYFDGTRCNTEEGTVFLSYDDPSKMKVEFLSKIEKEYRKGKLKNMYDKDEKGYLPRFMSEMGLQSYYRLKTNLNNQELSSKLEKYYEDEKRYIKPTPIVGIQEIGGLFVNCESLNVYISDDPEWIKEQRMLPLS